MNLNPMTLIAEIITFALFVFFTMKFVWPPVVRALEARRTKIAEGLAAAAKGEGALEEAQKQVESILAEARERAAAILRQAEERADGVLDEARMQAKKDAENIVSEARQEVQNEVRNARQEMHHQIAGLALKAAGQVVRAELDDNKHKELVSAMIKDWR